MKPFKTTAALMIMLSPLVWHTACAQAQPTPGWQVLTHQDTLSGKTVTEIALDPTSDTDNEFDKTGIYIRCSATQSLDFYVEWDVKLTDDTSAQTFGLDYRIGGGDVQNGNWQLSSDDEGQFYPADVVKFIATLEASNVFVARATPVGMNPITATYDTSGLADAVAPVLQACGYTTG